MGIIQFFSENAWNIVTGIGTGIISSIFVSKIFLIYQDVKSDFIEIVKHTTALEKCKVFYHYYKDPEFAKLCHVKVQEDGTFSKDLMFFAMGEVVFDEMQELRNIYTKYMDKNLIEIKKEYEAALTILHTECEEQFRREESMQKIFAIMENALKKFDVYQKEMFKRTMILILKDKLIIFLLVFFVVMFFGA